MSDIDKLEALLRKGGHVELWRIQPFPVTNPHKLSYEVMVDGVRYTSTPLTEALALAYQGECPSEESPPADPINYPAHYTHGKIEPIDVIEDWRLGFCLGNTLKYLARAEHKGTALDDLRKARWYLDHEIARREAEQ